ncbi:hypothetical protein ACHAQJ_007565 [Trichoderma viride]
MHRDRNGVHRGGPHDRPLAEMTREELLWDIRIFAEEVHQCNLWLAISRHSCIPSACDANANRPLKMSVDDFYDTCNKSVLVYISPTPKWSLLQIVLHNYIFRRWLRPYRSVEEGLSAPITFEPIEAKINRHIESEYAVQVTLETAIDFVMNLEAREMATFGLRPDPVAEWKPNEVDVENWRKVGETGPLIGPSSQWAMDTEKYPWRRADGREFHFKTMVLREQYEFPREARREAEEIKRTAGVSDSNFDNQ